MTELNLKEIEERRKRWEQATECLRTLPMGEGWHKAQEQRRSVEGQMILWDIPALIAEVRQLLEQEKILKDRLEELGIEISWKEAGLNE